MLIIPYPVIDPIAIDFGALQVRWYGISYMIGLLGGWYYYRYLLTKFAVAIQQKDIDDFIAIAALGVVTGGRLGHVFFYDMDYYLNKPWEILYIWQPGMSFHGGLLGVIIATLVYTYYRHLPTLVFGDLLALVSPIGLFFGRIANFINGELFGRMTNVAWAMVFPMGGPYARHPSQLYEAALEGIGLFLILNITSFKWRLPERYPGIILGAFLVFYGIFRIIIEYFRQPDDHIGYLIFETTLGQLLSFPLVISGIFMIYICYKTRKIHL